MGRTQRQRRRRNNCKDLLLPESASNDNHLPALHQHLTSLGWTNSTKLLVCHYQNCERGVSSKKCFRSGDTLMSLPLQGLISIATIEEDETFKQQFDTALFSKDITYQALLAFYVLYHKHLAAQSPLKAYIDTLPNELTMPYFCKHRELQFVPEIILERAVKQNADIRAGYMGLKNVFLDKRYFEHICSLDQFKWAYFVVNSRSVYVSSYKCPTANPVFDKLYKDRANQALAPLMDCFNHSDNVETEAEIVNTEGKLAYVLRVKSIKRALPPYQQLFISYGHLTNLNLLTNYGFFLPNNSHEYFTLTLNDVQHFTNASGPNIDTRHVHRNKFKFIREHNLDDEMFLTLNDGPSHNLNVVLNILFKQPSYFNNDLNRAAFGGPLECVEHEVKELIRFKLKEYLNQHKAMDKLEEQSASAKMCCAYVKDAMQYLQRILEQMELVE